MRLQVSKWGNSLAVRLPANYARKSGIVNGDYLEATVSPNGEMLISPCRTEVDKTIFLKKLATLHKTIPQTTDVMEILREEARF